MTHRVTNGNCISMELLLQPCNILTIQQLEQIQTLHTEDVRSTIKRVVVVKYVHSHNKSKLCAGENFCKHLTILLVVLRSLALVRSRKQIFETLPQYELNTSTILYPLTDPLYIFLHVSAVPWKIANIR